MASDGLISGKFKALSEKYKLKCGEVMELEMKILDLEAQIEQKDQVAIEQTKLIEELRKNQKSPHGQPEVSQPCPKCVAREEEDKKQRIHQQYLRQQELLRTPSKTPKTPSKTPSKQRHSDQRGHHQPTTPSRTPRKAATPRKLVTPRKDYSSASAYPSDSSSQLDTTLVPAEPILDSDKVKDIGKTEMLKKPELINLAVNAINKLITNTTGQTGTTSTVESGITAPLNALDDEFISSIMSEICEKPEFNNFFQDVATHAVVDDLTSDQYLTDGFEDQSSPFSNFGSSPFTAPRDYTSTSQANSSPFAPMPPITPEKLGQSLGFDVLTNSPIDNVLNTPKPSLNYEDQQTVRVLPNNVRSAVQTTRRPQIFHRKAPQKAPTVRNLFDDNVVDNALNKLRPIKPKIFTDDATSSTTRPASQNKVSPAANVGNKAPKEPSKKPETSPETLQKRKSSEPSKRQEPHKSSAQAKSVVQSMAQKRKLSSDPLDPNGKKVPKILPKPLAVSSSTTISALSMPTFITSTTPSSVPLTLKLSNTPDPDLPIINLGEINLGEIKIADQTMNIIRNFDQEQINALLGQIHDK